MKPADWLLLDISAGAALAWTIATVLSAHRA
jgi:hypothetical protein